MTKNKRTIVALSFEESITKECLKDRSCYEETTGKLLNSETQN